MPGRDTQYEALAREAADRIDRDRHLAEQLTMLPDEPEPEDQGKGKRGKGKQLSQLREWLASKGYELPEEQIARMAGLSDGRDPIAGAMADAERIVAWAFDGKKVRVETEELVECDLGDGKKKFERLKTWKLEDATPSASDFIAAFERCYASRQRAVEALLPYGLAKITPDAGDLPSIPAVLVPMAPSQVGQMRDVTPVSTSRMMPADVLHQIEQNQQVSDAEIERPTKESRTE